MVRVSAWRPGQLELPLMTDPEVQCGRELVEAPLKAGAAPFPLPVAPFELYYLCDDRPGYPTSYPFVMTVKGDVDRDALKRAWEATVGRHPLLSARLANARGWRPRWVAGAAAPLEWAEEGTLTLEDQRTFDLEREPGMRGVVTRSGDRTVVALVLHHACCDGIGVLAFFEDLLVAYDHDTRGEGGAPPWRTLNPMRLQVRGEFGLRGYRPTVGDIWGVITLWCGLLMRPAARVRATSTAQGAESQPADDFITARLTEQQTANLARSAKSRQVTVNDLMMAELFQVLAKWDGDRGRRPYRVTVPANLRLPDDAEMPAADVLSFAFVERQSADLKHHDVLLRSIQQTMAAIKERRLGLQFIGGLQCAALWPGLMRWVLNRRLAFATAVFSNLGSIFETSRLPRRDGLICAGSAVVESFAVASPIRPDTRAAMVVFTYAGRLTLSLRCDPRHFDRASRAAFLDDLVQRLSAL